jgi:serine protease AprX
MTDHYTPADPNDDQLASFSATGPTYEGFVKPDLVAPGGHMVGLMSHDNVISRAHPSFRIQYSADKYFRMSGTSQSAAVVSGIAALMLQANPALTPDDVKCGLTATAGAEWSVSGPYTVFQQGAGLVNAYSAVHSGLTRCANTGLNIAMDLAGNHFGGPAGQDGRGNFFLMDGSATDTAENGGHGNVGAHPWTSGYGWSNGYPWSSGLVEAASVNVWVDQE